MCLVCGALRPRTGERAACTVNPAWGRVQQRPLGHVLVRFDPVVLPKAPILACVRCGGYTTKNVQRVLGQACKGRAGRPGKAIARLMRGRHPDTSEAVFSIPSHTVLRAVCDQREHERAVQGIARARADRGMED